MFKGAAAKERRSLLLFTFIPGTAWLIFFSHSSSLRHSVHYSMVPSSQPLKPPFLSRVEGLLTSKVTHDHERLSSWDARLQHSDLMRELDRFPVFDRLMDDLRTGTGSDEGRDMKERDEIEPILGPEGEVGREVANRVGTLVLAAAERREAGRNAMVNGEGSGENTPVAGE